MQHQEEQQITPREFFPHMPDEVFDSWLAPFIEQIGWPFKSPDDDLTATRWNLLLGLIPLRAWYGFRWSLHELDASRIQLSQGSRWAYRSIIEHGVSGTPTAITAELQDTQHRFWTCAEYVRDHGTIPVPIVALFRDGLLEVMDGNHRMAAIFHVGVSDQCGVPAWIASAETE